MAITMVTPSQQSVLEITVLSVEGLRHNSFCLCSRRIRPFITLTKLPAPPTHADKASHAYNSKGDDEGGFKSGWDQKFRVPVDPTFFSDRYSSIHVQLYKKRPIVGQDQLGWCLIPAADIGFLPPGSIRYLSYRVRCKDGSRGNGIIDLSVTLDGFVQRMSTSAKPTGNTCHTVIGIPVKCEEIIAALKDRNIG
ncbi:hypothetical protein L6164_028196 [Bauhinia variegata]|uniref:Uncharacterized protein n=1 Tax=Bauhinia variegata TaxID=167791 RepID=A0ACB9LVQ0_BAUVA|nr:hypothetical protein L6164_028196 [Bauhinia variegata]